MCFEKIRNCTAVSKIFEVMESYHTLLLDYKEYDFVLLMSVKCLEVMGSYYTPLCAWKRWDRASIYKVLYQHKRLPKDQEPFYLIVQRKTRKIKICGQLNCR